MRNTPKVSIVTPSYNQAAFIEETIRSIFDQDYPAIEYIVIDGNSTDGSQEIICKYESRLAYWVSEVDAGQSDAINKGMARSTGDILTWINSDDTLLPGAVTTIVELFRKHPDAGMIYGDAWLTNAQSERLSLGLGQPFSLASFLTHPSVPQPASFFTRATWEACGPLDVSLHYGMDRDLWLRMATKVPIYYEPVTLATMRYHADSKSVHDRAPLLVTEKAVIDRYFATADPPPEALAVRATAYARLYYNLGMTYSQQGRFDEASVALHESLRWQRRTWSTVIIYTLLAFGALRSSWFARRYPSLMSRLYGLTLRARGRV